MIRVTGLAKRFGNFQVLAGVDIDFRIGCVTAVLGPNAAGKTTLIKSILGLTKPDAGTIEFDGTPVNGCTEYRSRIGYMPQFANFPGNLRGGELLTMLGDLRTSLCLQEPDLTLIDAFGMRDQLDKPLNTLSGGTRQKLNAVIAFMFNPDLLILDEPTAGLDPVASGILKLRISEARAQGSTVLLTSHIISEVEELADDAVFLLDGLVRFSGSVSSLMAGTRQQTLERAIARMMLESAA